MMIIVLPPLPANGGRRLGQVTSGDMKTGKMC